MASRLVILLSLLSLFSTFTFSKHLLVEVEDGEGLEDEGEADADASYNANAANDADDDLDDEDPSAADDKVANRARFNRYAGKRIWNKEYFTLPLQPRRRLLTANRRQFSDEIYNFLLFSFNFQFSY